MKKLLALVLALVMTLGLATVSTSAAYSDADDIDYTEAVDVMTAVGVFQGKGDAFAPKDGLNRAEAAKLIAYLMLGNKTAESMQGSGTKFTDVPASHWAAGFIEYLASVGVVSGVGNNQFDPNGQVTGVQFAKMLLVALGYDAEIEGFVGADWSINIQKVANKNDLFSGLDITASAALNREQAAQMCLNDLKADMVEYDDKGTTVNVGGATVITGVKNAKEVVEKSDKNYNAADPDTHDRIYRQLAEELYGNDLKLADKGTDDFGRPSNKWTYKNEEVGTYDSSADLLKTYTAKLTKGALYDLVGKSVYDNIVDGKATLTVVEDGFTLANAIKGNEDNVKVYIDRNNGDKINNDGSTGNGTLTQVYKDDDDNVTVVIINTYVYQASADYRTASETLVIEAPDDAGSVTLDSYTLDLDDFEQIKDYKEDDYLLITAYRKSGTGAYTVDSVKKAELLTGTVDSVVVTDSVTLDGEKKSYSRKASNDTKNPGYSVGQEATVVLDAYGYIIYVDEAVVAHNYVFIADIGATSSINSKVVADAYFTDGTNQEITVKEIDGKSNKTNMVAVSTGTTLGKQTTWTDNSGGSNNGVVVANNVVNEGIGADGDGIGVVGNKRMAGWYTYSKNAAGEYSLYSLSASKSQGVYTVDNRNQIATTDVAIAYNDRVAFLNGADLTALGTTYYTGADNVLANTLKANDKTIFIVSDDDDEIDVYTGVKNIPDVSVLKEETKSNTTGTPKYVVGSLDAGRAIVFAVAKDSGYAEYVFVSLDGRNNIYGTEAESLKYFVNFDKEHKTTDNDTYYTYKMLDENAKEITVESEKILASHDKAHEDIYSAFYKTSVNKDEQFTRGTKLTASDGKYFYGSATGAITYNSGTLSINGTNVGGTGIDTVNFTLANDYKLTVVSRASALNKDKGASYEASVMSASALEALINGYTPTYTIQARLKDDVLTSAKKELIEAYVTINSVSSNTAKGITALSLTGMGTTLNATPATSYLKEDAATAIANAYDVAVNASTTFTLGATTVATGTIKNSGAVADATGITFSGTGAASAVTQADNGKYIVWQITDTPSSGTPYVRYFAVKITAGYSVTISGATLGTTYTATVDGAAYTAAVNKNQGTSTTIVVSAKDDNTLKTVTATVNNIAVAGTMNAEKTQWTLTTPVSGAVVVTVTTEGAPTPATVKYDAKEPAMVTFTDGATGSKMINGNESNQDLVTVADNTNDLSFTVAWGSDTPDFAKNVYYKDTGAKVTTFGSGESLTYRVPAANLGKVIVFGSATTTLTLDTGYTVTWAAAAATTNHNAFGAGSINGSVAAQKVPVDAVLTLAKAEAPAHFAKYVTTPSSLGGSAETVYVETNNTKPTFANNRYTVGTGAATLTVTETTADFLIKAGGIKTSANIESIGTVTLVDNKVFTDGTDYFVSDDAQSITLTGITMKNHTSERNYTISITNNNTNAVIVSGGSATTYPRSGDIAGDLVFKMGTTTEGMIVDGTTNYITITAAFSN